MFSLRQQSVKSVKLGRNSVRNNTERSQESVDKIDEEGVDKNDEDVDKKEVSIDCNNSRIDSNMQATVDDNDEATVNSKIKQRFNPFDERLEDTNNSEEETGEAVIISDAIVKQVIEDIVGQCDEVMIRYDDRKNPFMEDFET